MNSIKDASYSEWLVVNAQLGDSLALERLIRLWQQRLLLYGVNKLGESAAAHDALQECLIAICKGLGRLRDPAAFPKWAFQIMERRCEDHLRKVYQHLAVQAGVLHQLATETEDQPTDAPDESANAGSPDTTDAALTLEQALRGLPTALSQVLRLYYLEGFSLKDIAEITGVPEGTVKSRLYYARKQLAALLEE
jgi:RNA polymerase sigma factor (sigma-70 family)